MTGLFKIACLVILIIGNLADAISTYWCAKLFGAGGERNPIIRGGMETIGVIPTMIIKFIGISALSYYAYKSTIWWMNAVVGLPYLLVAFNNFKQTYKKEKQ